jgi:hypothetical protein
VPIWLKHGLLIAVIAAILYVLISPLPELAATGPTKISLAFVVFVIGSSLFFLASSLLSSSLKGFPRPLPSDDVLQKHCAMLC